MTERPIVVRLNARTFPTTDIEREILGKIDAEIVEIEGDRDDEIVAAAQDADAIMIISAYLHGPVIRSFKRVRVISRLGTGVDKIDLAAATEKGIVVANLPDFSTEEVADHSFALLLASARRLKRHEALIRSGRRPETVEGMRRLAAQTLGIIGLGRIGRAVARRAAGFGMRIIGFDPAADEAACAKLGIERVDFETILRRSDFLMTLCPLLPSTREMLGMNEFKKMKPTAVLINTGRGELLKESELADALNGGILAYAAIDVFGGINVFADGGFPTTHPYFSVENILLTPHVSANSEESLAASKSGGARSVVDVLSGRLPENVVNKGVLDRIRLKPR